ncbi:MAG: molybdopterin-synthase adenylyltransferase MoeB [Gammaproteobacteria bacterium]|nr:molybdopterin-synthase adenylyltransferase MoeB [Gammaproteobacteria bacterium]MBV8402739.1 molybdopterin-synthase adenylyltransferase MoeB [Gammaproteobacteria bacterium]
MSLSASERERYRRHLALPEIGAAGQEKLKAARVLIVGAGGLGSPAALYLAAAGCGTLGLIDGDRVDITNLQRQVLFDSPSIGQPKAAAGSERLRALNPELRIVAHAIELRAANVREIFAQYDLVLDGTDRLSARYLINDACVLMRRPLVSAAIHRFEGHLMTYVPDQGPCYRCLFPHAAEGLVANCAEAGVLGVLPGVLGTLQATEAIKLITGIGAPLTGRLLTYDALEMRFSEFRVTRRRDCAVCGDAPTITEPRDMSTSTEGTQGIRRLSAAALHEQLERGEQPLLVDVREDAEFAAGHLPGALHIPLGQLPQRLAEIDPQAAPVFICRSGGRSMAACQMALRANIRSPANLEGGMLAWAADIDPRVRVV